MTRFSYSMHGMLRALCVMVVLGMTLSSSWARPVQDSDADDRAAFKQQVAEYERAAKANNDALAWLGPMPAHWDANALSQRLRTAFDKAKAQVEEAEASGALAAEKFQCPNKADIGPIPKDEAVEAYLFTPIYDVPDAAWQALLESAQLGNWMARAQVYLALISDEQDSMVMATRRVQLLEWLQEHRIGTLYSEMEGRIIASGYLSDAPGQRLWPMLAYAALRGSATAQHLLGLHLKNSDDPQIQAAAQRMLACSRSQYRYFNTIYSPNAGESGD